MPGFIGLKLCPHLVILPSNFDKYSEVSELVKEIFVTYDPNYSSMSLDEAYLDLTQHLRVRSGWVCSVEEGGVGEKEGNGGEKTSRPGRMLVGYEDPQAVCRCTIDQHYHLEMNNQGLFLF